MLDPLLLLHITLPWCVTGLVEGKLRSSCMYEKSLVQTMGKLLQSACAVSALATLRFLNKYMLAN